MPDFNPDKERHRKHKFVVQKAWTDASRPNDGLSDGVATSRGVLKPDDEGRMLVNDEALAREIQQENPKELVVTRMNADDPADAGHKYFFTVPEMPWKRQYREAEAQESQKAQDETPVEVQETKEV